MPIERIGGLVSGMDTDSLVKKLMDAERIPVDRMKQKRQKLTWQSDMYRQWNSDLFTFRTKTLSDMKLSKMYGTFNVTSSDANKLSATARADALAGTYKMEVQQVADTAQVRGSNPAGGFVDGSQLTITMGNGKTVTIDIDSKDTLQSVAAKITNARGSDGKTLGIQAAYDDTLKQFLITTKDTGAAASFTIRDTNNNVLTKLGFSSSTVTATGQNAKFIYNNDGVVRESATNDVTLFGVNYTFKDAGTTTVTVSRDLDTEIKNIKDFIDKYNEIIDKLNKVIDEPVYRSYQPLTDEERKALTEKQIEQWEEKAKSGLLRRDTTLSSLVNNMRLHITGSVDNGSKYNSLSSIGIKSTSYKDQGKLYIDEDKLREALQEDPEAVQNLFIQSSDGKGAEKGLIHRLAEDVDNAMKQLTEKAGKSGSSYTSDSTVLGKILRDLDDRIYNAERDLTKKEDAYYKKFAAMEKAMSQYNAQSGWLAQQFAAR